MTVRWLTAFIDHPAATADSTIRFWQTATGSALSTRRGDRGQFATLLPPDGDPYLRVQETDDGSAGVHLDLHVDDVTASTERAVTLGATVVDGTQDSLALLRSPSGFSFCLVAHRRFAHRRFVHAERATRTAPFVGPIPDAPHLVDQVSIDIPFDAFAVECNFWSALTGWDIHGGSVPEFRILARPPGMALRILLQRLGQDDPATIARAHIDIAAGTSGDALASWHASLGATVLSRGRHWITLMDPAGLPYCLTERDPSTGSLPRPRR